MEYKKEKHIGTYRFDYADGDKVCNGRWNPYYEGELCQDLIDDINLIINRELKNYNSLTKIQEVCGGIFLSDSKLIEGLHSHLCNYCVRLYPSRGEYNGYIYIYLK